jgi:hypothetical protein
MGVGGRSPGQQSSFPKEFSAFYLRVWRERSFTVQGQWRERFFLPILPFQGGGEFSFQIILFFVKSLKNSETASAFL